MPPAKPLEKCGDLHGVDSLLLDNSDLIEFPNLVSGTINTLAINNCQRLIAINKLAPSVITLNLHTLPSLMRFNGAYSSITKLDIRSSFHSTATLPINNTIFPSLTELNLNRIKGTVEIDSTDVPIKTMALDQCKLSKIILGKESMN